MGLADTLSFGLVIFDRLLPSTLGLSVKVAISKGEAIFEFDGRQIDKLFSCTKGRNKRRNSRPQLLIGHLVGDAVK